MDLYVDERNVSLVQFAVKATTPITIIDDVGDRFIIIFCPFLCLVFLVFFLKVNLLFSNSISSREMLIQ